MQTQKSQRIYSSGGGKQHCSCQCHWDLSWVHFRDTRIAFGDVDGLFVVERRRHFLHLETKGPEEPVPIGQRITLEELSHMRGFCVCILRGPKGYPESIQFVVRGVWHKPQAMDRQGFQGFIDRWFDGANQDKSEIEFCAGEAIDGPDNY